MTMLEIVEDTTTITTPQDPHDAEFFAHYVRKEAIIQAAIAGEPATALCGKKWTPNRSVEGRQVCAECKEIFEDNDRLLGNGA